MIASVGRMMRKGGGGLAWPAGLKESIKAIYDPASQGMTNYDVIESYAEDFSKFPWNNKEEKYTGTLTPNTLTVTNVAVTSALIYTNSKPENFKVYITGIKDNQQVIFGDDTSTYRALIVEKDGVYDVNWEDNHHSYCIWCNFLGDCNITITQLPTSVLKDLSGNGNHAYLYGGKGKLNSGMGVYQQDFTNTRNATTVSSDGFEVAKKGDTYLARISIGYWNNRECNLLFETNNTTQRYFIRYRKANNDIVATVELYKGENIIPVQEDISEVAEVIFEGMLGDNEYIRVTEIPDYPNQLCYDGKMYAVCYDFPILTDYTVMADRTWFDIRSVSCFIGKRNRSGDNLGAFEFEFRANQALSFGRTNSIIFADSGIVYQTKNSYNGIGIESGLLDDTDVLIIGAAQQNINNRPQDIYIGCHGKIIIANRSFTEGEINWLKDNLFRK